TVIVSRPWNSAAARAVSSVLRAVNTATAIATSRPSQIPADMMCSSSTSFRTGGLIRSLIVAAVAAVVLVGTRSPSLGRYARLTGSRPARPRPVFRPGPDGGGALVHPARTTGYCGRATRQLQIV